MTATWIVILTVAAAVGSGLNAGLFFAFSTSVMPALAQLPPAQGIVAMKKINVVILNPLFGLVFGGTALAAAAAVVVAIVHTGEAGAIGLLVGGVAFLVGAIGLTMGYHVPRNNAVDALAPADPAAPDAWARYLREWVPWNHVRTVASLIAAVSFSLALLSL